MSRPMRDHWFYAALDVVGISVLEYDALGHRVPGLHSEVEQILRSTPVGQAQALAMADAIRWAKDLADHSVGPKIPGKTQS